MGPYRRFDPEDLLLEDELEPLLDDLDGDELRLPPEDDREGEEALGALLDDEEELVDEGLDDELLFDP